MSEKTYYENAGKGCNRRPDSVSQETYRSNWDAIFSKKPEQSKQEIFEKNKNQNYIDSLRLSGLEKPFCISCGNSGKVFDAGWEYECQVCKQNFMENK